MPSARADGIDRVGPLQRATRRTNAVARFDIARGLHFVHRIRAGAKAGELVLAVLIGRGRGHNLIVRVEQLNRDARQHRVPGFVSAIARRVDEDHAIDRGGRLDVEIVIRTVHA